MIPFNTIEGSGFRRPSEERAQRLAGELHQRGILARLRNSAGQDVDGGCGQLRARALAGEAKPGARKQEKRESANRAESLVLRRADTASPS